MENTLGPDPNEDRPGDFQVHIELKNDRLFERVDLSTLERYEEDIRQELVALGYDTSDIIITHNRLSYDTPRP